MFTKKNKDLEQEETQREIEGEWESGQGDTVNQELPTKLVVGFLIGAKQKDADNYVRNLMATLRMDLPNSGYSLLKFRGGIAYEIQEGGSGGSWLKSILALLTEQKTIVVPASERFIQVELEETSIHCTLLRNGDSEEVKAVTPTKSGKLKPYHNYVQIWLNTAVAIAVFSVLVLTMILWAQKLITENNAERIVGETIAKTQSLPILYWPEVIGEDMYVAKLEFKEGNWLPPVFKSFNEIEDPNSDLFVDSGVTIATPQGFALPSHIPEIPDIIVNSGKIPTDTVNLNRVPATR